MYTVNALKLSLFVRTVARIGLLKKELTSRLGSTCRHHFCWQCLVPYFGDVEHARDCPHGQQDIANDPGNWYDGPLNALPFVGATANADQVPNGPQVPPNVHQLPPNVPQAPANNNGTNFANLLGRLGNVFGTNRPRPRGRR